MEFVQCWWLVFLDGHAGRQVAPPGAVVEVEDEEEEEEEEKGEEEEGLSVYR